MSRTFRGKKPAAPPPSRYLAPFQGIKKPASQAQSILTKYGEVIKKDSWPTPAESAKAKWQTRTKYSRPDDGTFFGSFDTRQSFWSRFEADFGSTRQELIEDFEKRLDALGEQIIPSESNLLSGRTHTRHDHDAISQMLKNARQNYESDPIAHSYRIRKDQRYADQFVAAERQYRKDQAAAAALVPSGLAAGLPKPSSKRPKTIVVDDSDDEDVVLHTGGGSPLRMSNSELQKLRFDASSLKTKAPPLQALLPAGHSPTGPAPASDEVEALLAAYLQGESSDDDDDRD